MMKFIKVLVFEFALLLDIPVIVGLFFINKKYNLISVFSQRDDVKDVTNCLIGTFVSISGFSLAALTIIITIRANVLAKSSALNMLESLFKSDSYFRITGIFKRIIIEQTFCALLLILSWTIFKITSVIHLEIILMSCYILLITVCRLFYILFFVIEAEKVVKPKRPEAIPQQNF